MYTDGACSGNPGPAGIGVVLLYKGTKKEISLYIGEATNNIAELTAIKVGLESFKRTDVGIDIYTDSQYAIGVLTQNWKAKSNIELIKSIKDLFPKFKLIRMIHVRGHNGDEYNELVDKLAVAAIKNRSPLLSDFVKNI